MKEKSSKILMAYFYKPNSLTIDGWKERMTCLVDENNRPIGKYTYEQIMDEGWAYLGTFELTKKQPEGRWGKALVTATKI